MKNNVVIVGCPGYMNSKGMIRVYSRGGGGRDEEIKIVEEWIGEIEGSEIGSEIEYIE